MRRPAPLPPALTGRAFSVAEAKENGVTRSRTRASDLSAPYRGVRMPRGQAGLLERCAALATRMSPHQYFSHSTAAALHGLPVPRGEEGVIHVTTRNGRSPRITGVTGHRSEDARLVTRAGLPVSAPVAAWCEIAELATLDELIHAGDSVLRRQNPLADRLALEAGVSWWGRRRGARALAEALRWVRPGTDSPQETRIRLLLVRAGLPEPQVNGVIADAQGRFVGLGDLVYEQFKIVIEYDGAHHFTDDRQVYRDVDRVHRIAALGWRVIRINRTHTDAYVRATVTSTLIAAGWRP